MSYAVKVDHVSKKFRKGQASYRTLREDLYDLTGRLFHLRKHSEEADAQHMWALRDVSFEIQPGERVGIIGPNGSGKTTLLRLLSGITRPTTGRLSVNGRLGAIIELMAGFHPELTGRENVYLNGAIMGMSQKEIRGKFDEIVAFADIEPWIDTPIKRYSSGMHVRLGFAIAAHLNPDVLLVDEVLAVGDAAFQKKCLAKMGSGAQEGRTVLFVSHNMLAVQSLCTRTIWLEDGKLMADGPTKEVAAAYLGMSGTAPEESVWDDMRTAPGNDKVRLHLARARHGEGLSVNAITTDSPVALEFEYWNLESEARINLSLLVYNDQGVLVFNATPMYEPVWHGRPFPRGLFRDTCQIPGGLLNDGEYRVDLLVIKDQSAPIYNHDSILSFSVRESVGTRLGAWYGKWQGIVRPRLAWTTELVVKSD